LVRVRHRARKSGFSSQRFSYGDDAGRRVVGRESLARSEPTYSRRRRRPDLKVALPELDLRKAALALEKAQYTGADRFTVELAALDQAATELVAPFDGLVTETSGRPGEILPAFILGGMEVDCVLHNSRLRYNPWTPMS
jgi:hypothetical protein